MKPAWSLDDISWTALEPEAVDSDLLEAVKTAALVEANSADYVRYLHNVFADDPAFREAASYWGVEERQHGDALGRWAEAVDPTFDYEQSLARFRAGYQIPIDADQSVRGSCAGELVARCVVESGTCSFYSAIRDRTAEPVLKQIAGFIAQDEARHYRLFKTHLDRYLAERKLGFFARCRIAYARVAEADDDELAYAYYSANIAAQPAPRAYRRRDCARAYSRRTLQLYECKHLRAALHMILHAANINPAGRVAKLGVWLGWRALQFRVWRLQHAPGAA
ncbi:MAG: ferritin-like domain-containing protein [Gammaproteobacteria bacterium]